MRLTGTGVIGVAALLAAIVAFVLLYLNRDSIIAAVNPLNENNLANQAAGAAATALTGREETFGGWLAELFNPATLQVQSEYAASGQSNVINLFPPETLSP